MDSIAVIDYVMGNLRSVAKALEHVAGDRAQVLVTSDPGTIEQADRVVFPGQGAARDCMHELTERGLVRVVRAAAERKPFLGICMGMQILARSSEEDGGVPCLDIVPGQVKALRTAQAALPGSPRYKLPHMGWNQVHQRLPHPLWRGIARDARFYFVHSYYCAPREPELAAATTRYPDAFTSAIARDNIFATQFHPEKSAIAGLTLLSNFAHWNP